MNIIAIIIIIIIVILIFVLIRKHISGGMYTTYDPIYQYTPRELINDATELYLAEYMAYNSPRLNLTHDMNKDDFANKWTLNQDVPVGLADLATNLLNAITSIEPIASEVDLEAFVIAFVEAVVACYIDMGIELTDFNTANSAMGTFNIVIFCKDDGEDRVLRIYKRNDAMEDSSKWSRMIDDSIAIKDIFSTDNLISLPIYSSAYIKHNPAFKFSGKGRMYGAQWMLLPKLNKFYYSCSGSLGNGGDIYDWIFRYIDCCRNVAIKLHDNDMVFCDWKWSNTMVNPETNKVLVSDIEFYSLTNVVANNINSYINFATTHKCNGTINSKIITPLKYDILAKTVDVNKYKELVKHLDNFLLLRDILATVYSLMYMNKTGKHDTSLYWCFVNATDLYQYAHIMQIYNNVLAKLQLESYEASLLEVCNTVVYDLLFNSCEGINIEPMDDLYLQKCTDAIIQAINKSNVSISQLRVELYRMSHRSKTYYDSATITSMAVYSGNSTVQSIAPQVSNTNNPPPAVPPQQQPNASTIH